MTDFLAANQVVLEYLKVIAAIVGGVWSVLVWRHQREKERTDVAARRGALYAMPFLMAAEALQSRLFNILSKGGLSAREHRDPADEFLILTARMFGWERCMRRYTHYCQNMEFIRLVERMRDVFANDTPKYGNGLKIFRNDQDEIGRLALARVQGEFGEEFDAIPRAAALGLIHANEDLAAVLNLSISPLRDVKGDVATLDEGTHTRLKDIQCCLCDILELVERCEGTMVRSRARQRTQ